jgi:demethylmenaquinone methyltransferase/2-methoxy-6-polyprenyl-1,4-benzoquinol methylase
LIHRSEIKHASYVRDIFTQIAGRYDLMNRLMTGGQDVRWREEVIQRARLERGQWVLDIGAGTGDLIHEAKEQNSDCHVLAADFTVPMMRIGQKRYKDLYWTVADALFLPLPDSTFDAVISGFLMRNVRDIQQALSEQYRILKPGGRIIILDTTRPKPNLLTPLIYLYMHIFIPFAGWLLTAQRDAYAYLVSSTENFLRAETLAEKLSEAGFQQVCFTRKMFGTIAIHWAYK